MLNVDCKPTATDLPSVEAGELRRYDRPQPSMDVYEQLRPNWTAPSQTGSSLPIANWPVATEVVL